MGPSEEQEGLAFFPGDPGVVPELPWDPEERLGPDALDELVRWVQRSVAEDPIVGHDRVVLGLSGGLDSSVAALLMKTALGAERVTCVVVDLGARGHADQADRAEELAGRHGLRCRRITAPRVLEQQVDLVEERGPFSFINAVTRLIHGLVFQVADAWGSLVVSTVNRTELLTGRHMEFFYGHLAPLTHLYKSEVACLGRRLGLDEAVIAQASGCTESWSDLQAFGVPTGTLDAILERYQREAPAVRDALLRQGVRREWIDALADRLAHPRWRLGARSYFES